MLRPAWSKRGGAGVTPTSSETRTGPSMCWERRVPARRSDASTSGRARRSQARRWQLGPVRLEAWNLQEPPRNLGHPRLVHVGPYLEGEARLLVPVTGTDVEPRPGYALQPA